MTNRERALRTPARTFMRDRDATTRATEPAIRTAAQRQSLLIARHKRLEQARNAGFKAFTKSFKKKDNPFILDRLRKDEWEFGWMFAKNGILSYKGNMT